jgi:hypothetical protein
VEYQASFSSHPNKEYEMAKLEQLPASGLEEVTQAAFSGLIRALNTHDLELKHFPGPVLVGIWAWPGMIEGRLPEGVAGGIATESLDREA